MLTLYEKRLCWLYYQYFVTNKKYGLPTTNDWVGHWKASGHIKSYIRKDNFRFRGRVSFQLFLLFYFILRTPHLFLLSSFIRFHRFKKTQDIARELFENGDKIESEPNLQPQTQEILVEEEDTEEEAEVTDSENYTERIPETLSPPQSSPKKKKILFSPTSSAKKKKFGSHATKYHCKHRYR